MNPCPALLSIPEYEYEVISYWLQEHGAKEKMREGYKTCTKCLEEKPFYKFHVDMYSSDGYYSVCKECRRGYRRVRNSRKYEDTVGGSDELMAYEAWCRLKCRTDADWAKPEFSLGSFRTQVRTWVLARRKLGRPMGAVNEIAN